MVDDTVSNTERGSNVLLSNAEVGSSEMTKKEESCCRVQPHDKDGGSTSLPPSNKVFRSEKPDGDNKDNKEAPGDANIIDELPASNSTSSGIGNDFDTKATVGGEPDDLFGDDIVFDVGEQPRKNHEDKRNENADSVARLESKIVDTAQKGRNVEKASLTIEKPSSTVEKASSTTEKTVCSVDCEINGTGDSAGGVVNKIGNEGEVDRSAIKSGYVGLPNKVVGDVLGRIPLELSEEEEVALNIDSLEMKKKQLL